MHPWVTIAIITLTELLGDLHLQKYASHGSTASLILGGIIYLGLACEVAFGLKFVGIGWLNGARDGTSALLASFVGWLQGEQLATKQWVGLLLVGVGVSLL